MLMKRILFCGFLGVLMACSGGKKAPDEIIGTYSGTLPCADCPGILFTLTLKKDFRYERTRYYLESEPDTFEIEGKFTYKDSIITLESTAEKIAFNQMKFSKGQLIILNKDGKEIKSKLANYYRLHLQKKANNISSSAEKSFFKATGNEPFWMVKLDFENERMLFSSMNEGKMEVKLPEKQKVGKAWQYAYKTETSTLLVTISEEECQDSMSGSIFSHQVELEFKTPEMAKPKTVIGCGSFGYESQ